VPRPRTSQLAAGLLILAVLLGWAILSRSAAPRQPVGLFTSLPILWGEGEGLAQALARDRPPHPVATALNRIGPVQPLDTLEQLQPGLGQLVIAQPRPLSPTENVALDTWVRGGGHLLLFADPLLTAHSAFAVGDPRRPQDVVLLSPILTRWGLELTFAEDQPEGLRVVPGPGPAIPVNLRGGWRASAEGCQVEAEGLVATCRIGRGHVVAVADAEVLTDADPDAIRGPALAALLRRAFANH